MKTIIQSGIKKSMSYDAYLNLVKELVENRMTTGNEQTITLINYTKLNERRMRRWNKNLKISSTLKKKLLEFKLKVTWLVITESWCGDAAHILPVFNKIAAVNSNINYRVVLRDENPQLINAFLTFGSKAIPKLIVIDDTSGEVLETYGPRPSEASRYVSRFKANNGGLTDSFKTDLQHWYNNDKGKNIINDIIQLLSHIESASVYQ